MWENVRLSFFRLGWLAAAVALQRTSEGFYGVQIYWYDMYTNAVLGLSIKIIDDWDAVLRYELQYLLSPDKVSPQPDHPAELVCGPAPVTRWRWSRADVWTPDTTQLILYTERPGSYTERWWWVRTSRGSTPGCWTASPWRRSRQRPQNCPGQSRCD